jgi:hypothetical protein
MKPTDFSALTVCGLDELDRRSGRSVTHVLSILDPEWAEPEAFEDFDPHFRTTLRFHDAIEPDSGVVCRRNPTSTRSLRSAATRAMCVTF